MALIKDSELKMARLQIETAIQQTEQAEIDNNVNLSYIIKHLTEALAHLNN